MLGPADDDHQLAVRQVTQRGESLDVALGHGGVRHGVDLLRLRHQQVGHDLGHCGVGGAGGVGIRAEDQVLEVCIQATVNDDMIKFEMTVRDAVGLPLLLNAMLNVSHICVTDLSESLCLLTCLC